MAPRPAARLPSASVQPRARIAHALVLGGAALLAACGGAAGGASADAKTVDGATSPDAPRPSACDQPFPAVASPPANPPYSGTAFLAPGLITDADPTSLVSVTYAGQGLRQMYDRRTESFNQVNAHLFDARFGATVTVEIQVNPELSQADADTEARYYAAAVGRLPAFLFRDLQTMWIHAGLFPFGGGNNNLLIHTAQGADYAAGGYLEEIFLHEGAHTSLDAYHATTARWQEAQAADGVAISTYARDNPAREDVAETLVPYLAQRFFADRLPADDLATIRATIPNRIIYLDCLALTAAPVARTPDAPAGPAAF